MSTESCYTALGLDVSAPSEEIKRAYRNLSLKLHPDTSGTPATARRFSRMLKAYKILTSEPVPPPSSAISRKERPVQALGDAQDLFSLGSTLVESRNPADRVRAARLLGLSGKRSAWVFLRKGMLDSDEEVVCASIRAISVLSILQGGGEIAAVYARGSDNIKKNILGIAAATEADVFSAVLSLAQGDENILLRTRAKKIIEGMRISLD